jgi:hypothetical protein
VRAGAVLIDGIDVKGMTRHSLLSQKESSGADFVPRGESGRAA